jgi:hypothetical protein
MWNLTVSNVHTFAVGAGRFVVHNVCLKGPVVFRGKASWSPADWAAAQDFVDRSNQLIDQGYVFVRQAVSRQLRRAASKEASQFRGALENMGFDMDGYHAGHVPDTTWTGQASPPDWRPLPDSVNMSFGRQAQDYPYGYVVTRFHLK